jgi:hypothetical protein
MLKEDPRYDYAEMHGTTQVSTEISASARRRGKPKGLVLPVGTKILAVAATLPLQSYLQERFSHIGGKSYRFRALRAENQRRHDHAASLGHWQMSRTS